MRILLVHNRYRSTAPSGENRVVDQEREALTALGHDVGIFERHSDELEQWPAWKKATLPARVVWNPASKRDLAQTLQTFRPDVVHIHNTFPVLSPSVLYACRDADVPVVITLHNYKLLCASGDFYRDGSVCHDCAGGNPVPAVSHGCYRGSKLATATTVLNTRSHRRSWRNLVSAYLFVSESQRKLLAGMDFDPDRSFVRYNYVPYDGPVAGARRRQVTYVGRLDAPKGAPLLMKGWDAYREIAGDDALQLVIAGGGPLLDEVTAWAADRPSVELRGLMSKPEVFQLMRESRAVVLPSEWEETFGLVVVEAMAVGVPLLASAHGSFPELVTGRRAAARTASRPACQR
jgi:glycosyltransferase involved in cell wall biosynthesis